MLANCCGHRVGAVDSAAFPVPHSEIEIFNKKNLNRKIKMLANCCGHRVGAVDSAAFPVPPSEIEILRKKILKK